MARPHTDWIPVEADDELAIEGDESLVDTRRSTFYWNPRLLLLRRFGLDGSYAEVRCLSRPDAFRVSSRFSRDRLLAYAPAYPADQQGAAA